MTGRKTLGEVRAELEAAVGPGPASGGQVAEALRRFLAAGTGEGGASRPSGAAAGSEPPSAAEPGR